ncbi:LEAF RUST 10 DISEASE-RESISTANCE LOCUS RECEPTOR-LIKE PROTEIN KINASE-like 1.2 isoform X1 [Senna tora]|uniref:non-specific serine/threonine protein kinase n=1 Tax=Senna tora TaxID=362788 RepID=A0A834WNS9_9FABA|nr:LEAF RUST 10 DISEASE-RESISTANCE LOCUS RECEPTOR-LIKE PROTEIN KINASE-like 1.2 isoform X1 [Senna tora]
MNQTIPKSLPSSLLSTLLCFPLFLFPLILCSVNPKFTACEPKTCGNGQNISYPFYIDGKQDPSCGFPRFGLTCAPDGFPILNLSSSYFIIQQIFYHNHSLRVSDPQFSVSNATTECLSRSRNLTLYGNRYEFASKQKEILLFFDCATPGKGEEEYRVGCDRGNRTRSVLAMDDGNEKMGYAMGSCKGGFTRTMVMEDEGGGGFGSGREGIWEALRRGFVLVWKVTECEGCEQSGGRCGFDMESFSFREYYVSLVSRIGRSGHLIIHVGSGNSMQEIREKQYGSQAGTGISTGLGIGVPLLVAIGIIVFCWKRKYGNSKIEYRSRRRDGDPYLNSDTEEGSNLYFGVPVFSYTELEVATNNFDHTRELGDGGFGTVYYGKLQDGREVAVKRLYEQNFKRVEQFMNEVKILTRLRHKNLVSLYGCTSRHSRELLLVYEYIPNGTVAHHLHLHSDPTKPTVLPWPTRMKIALQTATALAYLHASDIIHRDVKTTNILLDDGFNVKVADFGLSRLFPSNVTHVSTAPQGTPGYVDPEYHRCYQLTSKSDVYSFGVVLIELVSSMAAVDMSRDRDEINLSSLAVRKIQRSELGELVDPSLGFERDGEVRRMVGLVAQLAFQCLQRDKELRPSMDEVLEVLNRIEGENRNENENKNKNDDGEIHEGTSPLHNGDGYDEVGLLKNMKIPPCSSPNSVADKWESKTTTPNVSA